MKLPTRLSIALGALITGLGALSLEIAMSPVAHRLVLLLGAFVLFLVHPAEAGTLGSQTPSVAPPFGMDPITPTPPVRPAERSLP